MRNDREIALNALMEILEKKQYSHYVIKQLLDKYGYLDKRERAFITRLIQGSIERCTEMDYIIDSFSGTPVRRMKPLIRNLMRMSVYQIVYMDAVPDSAACNEAVKLAGKRGFSSLKGFVNGVLRSVVRNKESLPYPDRDADYEAWLSVRYSMPSWIPDMWIRRFGRERTEAMLESFLLERPLTVRFNACGVDWERLLQRIGEAGIRAVPDEELPYAYCLFGADRVESIPGYDEGAFFVQDIGSMKIIEAADIAEGEWILDVCGAPGGKALHAADCLRGTGQVLVRDISEKKVSLIRENIERSRKSNIRAEVFDAEREDRTLFGRADLVIADLPCSELGVIGRKSDIKYRVKPEDIGEIAELQRRILSVVWQYVKPGGRLLFSTCTLTEEENEHNTAWFLEHFPFEKKKEETLYPGLSRSDGFYMAVFTRKE